MTPPRSEGYVRMPDAEFEAILTRAAEEGAKRALADVGLDGDEAALDIRDLRSLVDCIRLVRRTAMQTAVRMITTGVMLALLAGIAIKLKIFGGGPSSLPIPIHQPAMTRPRGGVSRGLPDRQTGRSSGPSRAANAPSPARGRKLVFGGPP